jgi:hypothetical protein
MDELFMSMANASPDDIIMKGIVPAATNCFPVIVNTALSGRGLSNIEPLVVLVPVLTNKAQVTAVIGPAVPVSGLLGEYVFQPRTVSRDS